MDTQTMINILIAAIGAIGGGVIKALWDSITDLKDSDKVLTDRVHSIETLVAGTYIKREEFNRSLDMLSNKLDSMNLNLSLRFDSIAAKLETKMNREDCREIHGRSS